MFRPVRTLLLVLVAFAAGIFFERNAQREACLGLGGTYAGGLCRTGGQ
jgi:hypothetical protein